MIIGVDANEANVKDRVGSNQFAFQILTSLHKLDKKNHFIVFLKQPPLPDLPPASENWQYRLLRPGFLWTQWRLPLNLYFCSPRPQVFLSLGHYSPRFAPMPTLASVMDLAFLFFPHQFLTKDLNQLTAWTAYSVKKAAHLFAISKATKNDLQKHYHLTGNKITVTYPALVNSQSLKKISPPAKSYLLYLGTLQPRKNLEALVKAFSLLKLSHPQLKLVIAGKKGWQYQQLFALVNKHHLTHKVIFLGFVPPEQINSLISQAKLLILPSLYEGFGMPVLQAMSLNTPVLVSYNSSLKEIVGPAGYYIKAPFDSSAIRQGIITALTDSAQSRQQKISLAFKKSQQFSWDKSALKILQIIYALAV